MRLMIVESRTNRHLFRSDFRQYIMALGAAVTYAAEGRTSCGPGGCELLYAVLTPGYTDLPAASHIFIGFLI